ncbi:hypothetical protein D1872_317930 [compost metagenome]
MFRISGGIKARFSGDSASRVSPKFTPACPPIPWKADSRFEFIKFRCRMPKIVIPSVIPKDRRNELVEVAAPRLLMSNG